MAHSALTFYLENIFESYDDWKDFIQNNSSFVDYDDEIQANFDKWCFNLLMRHFNHTNIRYSTPNAFLGELLNVYENKFKQFMQEKSVIDKIHSLTTKDFELIQTSLSNIANNPNDDTADPTKPLNFISGQTYQIANSNKLRAYLDALNNMPTLNIYKFFKAQNKDDMGFEDLFMNIQPNQKFYFKGEKI